MGEWVGYTLGHLALQPDLQDEEPGPTYFLLLFLSRL